MSKNKLLKEISMQIQAGNQNLKNTRKKNFCQNKP